MKTRREFLKFIGQSSLSLSTLPLLQACQNNITPSPFPSSKDDVVLLNGLRYYPIISWGDRMNEQAVFGFNNDYINIHYTAKDELVMWVNHEYVNPLFVSGFERIKKNVDIERSLTGGSLIQLKQNANGEWKFLADHKNNKAVRADTMMQFAYGHKIKGSNKVEGIVSNCAGGKTPWNTFLTCEENYYQNYGEVDRHSGKYIYEPDIAWQKFYPHPPEHYGWVTEIDPFTGKAQKHVNLGRFSHESATCAQAKSGNVVVYSGDDKASEHLYKFVSKAKDNFKKGVLYVAQIETGKWLPLDRELSPQLKKHFKNQTEVLTWAREASKILGATELNRPEDIEIHPHTGDVYVSLTNNKKKKDYYGSILKISEKNNDHGATRFKAETFQLGGNLFSCPDNLAFDSGGNLWVATDISGYAIGSDPYKKFGHNGLFVMPTSGRYAGEVIQVASAPVDAEFTGLCFDREEKNLFVSVQHPGELTKDLKHPTSRWPNGGTPKSTVIAITGEGLRDIIKL